MARTLFVIGLRAEARPFVSSLGLSQLHGSGTVFDRLGVLGDDQTRLVVTGTGKVAAALGTAALLASETDLSRTVVVNVGICGCAPSFAGVGEIFLVHKVCDQATGHSWYPDILLEHSFREGIVTTSDTPVSLPADDGLCDMEASGFFQGALRFLSPTQVLSFKIVSDTGAVKKLDEEFVNEIVASHVSRIVGYVREVAAAVGAVQSLSEDQEKTLDTVSNELRLSFTQRATVKRAARMFVARTDRWPLSDFCRESRVNSKQERTTAFREVLDLFESTANR